MGVHVLGYQLPKCGCFGRARVHMPRGAMVDIILERVEEVCSCWHFYFIFKGTINDCGTKHIYTLAYPGTQRNVSLSKMPGRLALGCEYS